MNIALILRPVYLIILQIFNVPFNGPDTAIGLVYVSSQYNVTLLFG